MWPAMDYLKSMGQLNLLGIDPDGKGTVGLLSGVYLAVLPISADFLDHKNCYVLNTN